MRDLGRILIFAGAVLLLVGVVFTFAGRFGAGKLPGDFMVRRGNFTFYFPLMTSILISVALTFFFWFMRRG